LTYEAVQQVGRQGYGQSTAIGIGGDPIVGMKYIELLRLFKDDPGTEAVVLIGEIGGNGRGRGRGSSSRPSSPSPWVGFIAGQTAPPGRRMGHAGAIIAGARERPKRKWPPSRPRASSSPSGRRHRAKVKEALTK